MVLFPLGVFGLKRFTVGAFCSTSSGIEPKKVGQEMISYVRIGTSLERKFHHTLKTGSRYLFGLLFKISNQHSFPFHMLVSPHEAGWPDGLVSALDSVALTP